MLHTNQVWRQQKDYMQSGVNMDNFSVLYISCVFYILIFVQMRIPMLMVTSKGRRYRCMLLERANNTTMPQKTSKTLILQWTLLSTLLNTTTKTTQLQFKNLQLGIFVRQKPKVCVRSLPVFKVKLLLSNRQRSSNLMKDALCHSQWRQLDNTKQAWISLHCKITHSFSRLKIRTNMQLLQSSPDYLQQTDYYSYLHLVVKISLKDFFYYNLCIFIIDIQHIFKASVKMQWTLACVFRVEHHQLCLSAQNCGSSHKTGRDLNCNRKAKV